VETIDDLGTVKPIPTDAEQVWQGKVFSAWQWQQKQYDGSVAVYEALKRLNTAHTVVVLDDERILLTEDEQPNRGPVLTPPGGQVDPGEAPEEAARRELREETGYEVEQLVPWHTYRASTKIEWTVYAYIGRGARKVAEPELEAGERVTPRLFSFDEFLALGHNHQLRDRVLRIILLEALLDAAKKQELHDLLYGSES